MKIRSLTLKNIGVFEDETISFPKKQDKDLAEIHILTGQNGTGKTTILQALASGMDFRDNSPNRVYKNEKLHIQLIRKAVNSKGLIEVEFSTKQKFIAKVNNVLMGFQHKEFKHIYPLVFGAFAYSGYRFIENQENINIKEESNYNPLKNALEFYKTYDNDYTLNQWLANTISKRSFARDEGNEEKAILINRNIKNLEQVIEAIIKKPIKFEPFYEGGIKIVANIEGKKLDFDLLPDGLRSIISWLGDLIMRMDALKWKDDLPIFEREFILFLDEIEVHLHPSWQRKILPVVQKLFKNAQIFITTHSPFIVNSVDGAWIYDLELNDGKVFCKKPMLSKTSNSIDFILRKIFDVPEKYGKTTQEPLDKFYENRTKIMNGEYVDKKEFSKNVQELLALESRTIEDIVHFELEQLGKEYSI